MVSSISSSLLASQQAALKALQASDSSTTSSSSNTSATSATATTSMPSLIDILSSGDDDDDSDDASIFSALIASVKQQITALEGTTGTDGTSSGGDATDISSTAFMTSLKQKIEAMQQSPDTSDMGDAMMDALENGTLTVSDPTTGEQITAWDPDSSDETASEPTTIDESDWSSFLKDHLARESDGRYARNDDSSHQDKVNGDSAYFGMVNDRYAYLSWTPTAAADASTSTSDSTA